MIEQTLPVNITLIVDRSGSMQSIKNEVIGGINAFYEEQKKVPGDAFVTYTQFDNVYEVVFENTPLNDVPQLTEATFVPRGMTAMYDAVGRTLSKLMADVGDSKNPQIVVIMTDGAENSSSEYNLFTVKNLVEEAKSKNWQILFLGANIDAFAVGTSFGISADNITSYSADNVGSSSAVSSMSSKLSSMRSAYVSKSADWAAAGGTLADLYNQTVSK